MADSIFEFRGVQDLYYAQVLEDSEEKFTTTTPKRLAYVATIAKEVETSSETFVWKYKGVFAIPSEEVNTESDSIDTTNTELTYTAISTIHKFAYRDDTTVVAEGTQTTQRLESITGIVVDERYARADNLDEWFTKVMTPDDVAAKTA